MIFIVVVVVIVIEFIELPSCSDSDCDSDYDNDYDSDYDNDYDNDNDIAETIMTLDEFESDLEEIFTAEDFLEYFKVPYDPAVVQVNRLHILQRLHDYLEQAHPMPEQAAARWQIHADLLTRAYQDFVVSDAQTEKVFRVFQMSSPKPARIPLADLLGSVPHAAGL